MSDRRLFLLWLLLATMIAAIGTTDHAGGWNDGSRLATIESLVDRNTWVIDESVFVRSIPPESGKPHPYGPNANQFPSGTQDKLYIDGHFYSDKSPAPALILAVPYQIWRWCGGPSAAERPDLYCWFLSFVAAGGTFVLAVLGINRLAGLSGLAAGLQAIVVTSFMLGSIALPYGRSVNNHILLLSVATWLLVLLEQRSRVWLIGTLSGIAYSIDLGAGPIILLCTFLLHFYRTRSLIGAFQFVLAALPWLALHHALNFMIGGTFAPANANPNNFRWPGCPFDSTNLTGGWPHSSFGAFAIYAIDLLVGKKGFLTHQPQLYFAVAAGVVLLPRNVRRDMLLLTFAWFVGVWLVYAATSRNQSGVCVSIRWFVPLVAPAYYWLILGLNVRPECRVDVLMFGLGGAVINIVDWVKGPWSGSVGPFFWIVVAFCGCGWGWIAYRRRSQSLMASANISRIAA